MPTYRFLRHAEDTVEVDALTEADARRALVRWDSDYPLDRALRPTDGPVRWVYERYWADTLAVDDVPPTHATMWTRAEAQA